VTAPKVKTEANADVKADVKAAPAPVEEVKAAAPMQTGPVDISALRRLWPEVIENVKKKRRLTWSLLSASAQLISVDDKVITLGIVNPGAKESFLRSESDVLVRQAFVEVCGIDRKIEVIVDAAVNAPVHERTTEAPSDAEQLTGHALLMRELGAQVIAEGN
jgi:DNA polymerase-3 subunit gamma/tau